MSSAQCSHCQQWWSDHRNLMYHMAHCPAKYNNNDNEESLALLQHNPLKSSYDPHMSTKITVPCINENTARLFEVETIEIEGINCDICSQHSNDDSDSDTISLYDFYDIDYDEDSYNPQTQLSTAV